MILIKLENEIDVPNYHCGNCKYWYKNGCKRIDHERVKFSKPWFKSYDGHQHSGIICNDFHLNALHPNQQKVWDDIGGFNNYWKLYVEQWLPYQNTNVTVSFTLNGDTKIRYNVPLMDFVNGTMFNGNKLKAISKTYYKKARVYGYVLVTENIEGVEI